jgi:hypothetical protein
VENEPSSFPYFCLGRKSLEVLHGVTSAFERRSFSIFALTLFVSLLSSPFFFFFLKKKKRGANKLTRLMLLAPAPKKALTNRLLLLLRYRLLL